MNATRILNYRLNSEFFNFIDFFGDNLKTMVKIYKPFIQNFEEFEPLIKDLDVLDKNYSDFINCTSVCMNIFVTEELFEENYELLFTLLQEISIAYRNIIDISGKTISEKKIYHFSTTAIKIYKNFFKDWSNSLQSINQFIVTIINNKLGIYKENELNNYHKLLFYLIKTIISLFNEIDNYSIMINEKIDYINYEMATEIYKNIMTYNDLMISYLIFLILNIKYNIKIQDHKLASDFSELEKEGWIIREDIYTILTQNNYFL